MALGDGNADGLPVFQPPLTSQSQQQPTPLSTYSILRECAQPESLHKDCQHFKDRGVITQLILPSALSLVCSQCPQFPHWLRLYQSLSLTTQHEKETSAHSCDRVLVSQPG